MESEMCVKNRTFEIKLAFSIFGLQMLRALLRSGRLCNVLKERRSCRSLSEAGPGGEEDQQLLRELCAKIRFSGPIKFKFLPYQFQILKKMFPWKIKNSCFGLYTK